MGYVKDLVLNSSWSTRAAGPILGRLRRHRDFFQSNMGRKGDIFQTFSFVVENYVEDFQVFPGHGVAVDGLHLYRLFVSVLVTGFFEFRFLGCEPLDDLFWRGPFGLTGIEWAFLRR